MLNWKLKSIENELTLFKYKEFVVFDIETTGLSPAKGGEIIEIGAVKIINGKIVDTYQTFVQPKKKVSKLTTDLTSITQEMVEGQRSIGQVLPEFYEFIGNAVLVAHNAKFDWTTFIKPLFESVGIFAKNPVICTFQTFRKGDPGRGKGGYTLATLCVIAGVKNEHHHRALADAVATAHCFLFIQRNLLTPEELGTLNLEEENDETTEEVSEQVFKKREHTEVVVKRVRYWEKRINSNSTHKRQYVNLTNGENFGTVFFDIVEQAWYDKDFKKPLDFKVVEEKVLEFLNLSKREDLYEFRG